MLKYFFLFLACILASTAYGIDGISSPATPSPLTDIVSITRTGQLSIATTTLLISNDSGIIAINNESGAMLRVGTDTTVLTTGFGVPAGAVVTIRFDAGHNIYLDSSGTAAVSYLRGK